MLFTKTLVKRIHKVYGHTIYDRATESGLWIRKNVIYTGHHSIPTHSKTHIIFLNLYDEFHGYLKKESYNANV